MSSLKVGLGIMSGSSLDGIDLALVQFDESSFKILEAASLSFDKELRSLLKNVVGVDLKSFLLIEKRFTTVVAKGIEEKIKGDFDFIGVHGHTTIHLPEHGITHQLINGGILSALSRMPVVTDFRIGDITLGGVGTPLVPKLEKDLFPGYDYYLNLGGIANLSRAEDWSAFDVSPCNQLSNLVSQLMGREYDEDGRSASAGNKNQELYERLNDFSYYDKKAPKSLDNNWIKANYFPILTDSKISNEDKLCTINYWIADKLLAEIENGKTVFCTGGGTYNNHLIELLKNRGLSLIIPAKEIIDFKEAILMAYLAHLRIEKKTNLLSSATGAEKDSIGGAIYDVHGS